MGRGGLPEEPRGRRGRRYPLSALLCAAAASVPAGARSLAAIGEWIADAPRWALLALGFAPDTLTGSVAVPHQATVRRLLARLDGDALDEASGAFLTARAVGPATEGTRPVLRAIAVDGKTVRGSRYALRHFFASSAIAGRCLPPLSVAVARPRTHPDHRGRLRPSDGRMPTAD
ncbi:transposase family protein [Streptomyces sp. AC550_RSS872]|uniref:transposase family protein n=1 Tax=Streptomyces sp. AC550_RSS872 TaxID=2823689 RepID=UPI0027E3DDEF|nr:transposase family protein [Streptomyces sp. AC550_RSS872]